MKFVSILITIASTVFVKANEEANVALLTACMAGRGFDSVEDVKAALEDGADINTTDELSGQTPLMASVLRGKINIVKHLLAAGADTSIGEKMGYTPPHGAAFQGRPDVMKVLIDVGLDVNEFHDDGFVPLHRVCWGSEERHVETLKVLLEHGIPIDIKSEDGKDCEDMATAPRLKEFLNEHKAEL